MVAPATNIFSFRLAVTTPGTPVSLESVVSSEEPTQLGRLQCRAGIDNTGLVVIGDKNVVAAEATRRGFPLSPHDSFEISATNAAGIWLDSEVAGEYISGVFVTA